MLRSGGSLDGVALNTTDLVTFVTLTLVTSGGWNGDIYAYVEHNGAITVLLNRAGLTSENPAGAASSGMNVTFSDAETVDVHTALSTTFGALATGTYQPDGRAADPDEVLDSSPRTLSFSGFTGQVASGDWTLFIADVAGGETATLGSWNLTLTTTAVPEPTTGLSLLTLAAGALLIRRRSKHAA